VCSDKNYNIDHDSDFETILHKIEELHKEEHLNIIDFSYSCSSINLADD
jgi:hypothetical protein